MCALVLASKKSLESTWKMKGWPQGSSVCISRHSSGSISGSVWVGGWVVIIMIRWTQMEHFLCVRSCQVIAIFRHPIACQSKEVSSGELSNWTLILSQSAFPPSLQDGRGTMNGTEPWEKGNNTLVTIRNKEFHRQAQKTKSTMRNSARVNFQLKTPLFQHTAEV